MCFGDFNLDVYLCDLISHAPVKNYVSVIAEFAPGEPYTDQYKVKVIDLVSRSRYKVNNQDHSVVV